jgi:hypothetical protein
VTGQDGLKCADEGFSFLATFEKASTRDEILSSLHQAVVEVVTLHNSMSSLPGDLNRVTYTPEALASISSTAIELDDTGAHIVLKYGDGGRESILAAICGLNETRNPAFAMPKDAGSGVEDSEAREDFGSKHAEAFREVETKGAALVAQDVDKGQSRTFMGHKKEVGNGDGKSYEDYIEEISPQKRIPYTGISPNFVTFPLESPELLFAVSDHRSFFGVVLTQTLPDHQAGVPVDRTSLTRSPSDTVQDFEDGVQLSSAG